MFRVEASQLSNGGARSAPKSFFLFSDAGANALALLCPLATFPLALTSQLHVARYRLPRTTLPPGVRAYSATSLGLLTVWPCGFAIRPLGWSLLP